MTALSVPARPVVFTAPTGFTNYNFIKNGISVQNTGANTYSTSTLGNGDKIEVSVTGPGGCIGLLNQVVVQVNPLPVVAAITGPGTVCVNGNITLADTDAPGVWSSLNATIATVDASGVVTGKSPGTTTINYTFTNANGCNGTVSKAITVSTPPAVTAITGNFNICRGFASQLSDATPGGIWSSDNTGVASVNGTGLVSGDGAGNANISYTVTDANGCSTTVTALVTVSLLPTVAPITSASTFNVCVNGTLQLSDATSGGVWSSSNNSLATVNSSGVVSGIASGPVTITYSITTSCGQNAQASQVVNVNAQPSATISYSGSPFCTSSGSGSSYSNRYRWRNLFGSRRSYYRHQYRNDHAFRQHRWRLHSHLFNTGIRRLRNIYHHYPGNNYCCTFGYH